MFIAMEMKPFCMAGLALAMSITAGAQNRVSNKTPGTVSNKTPANAPAGVPDNMQGNLLAPTPPMGWNSWDSYGLTVTEEQFRQNMVVLAAQLKEFGWQYVVVDEGWYLQNPEDANNSETLRYTVNTHGQYEPAVNRFPSAKGGLGFKPLADAVHKEGLKFGIHIIRGIPKQTFMANARIGRTAFRANQAADPTEVCPWNPDNFGVKSNPAGQAWYDALIKQYADWGVDYLKVDCIAANPYRPGEIQMIHKAILKAGRPILLSLSPGPTSLDNAEEVGENAQMWRISQDVWDNWDNRDKATWSQSVKGQFGIAMNWVKYAQPGNWPDLDMLPIGELGPTPGDGLARTTRLTEDEQRTMLTLWVMARSPLFVGANLTQMDGFAKSILTNSGIIAVDQQTTENRWVGQDTGVVAWTAKSSTGPSSYLALFNLGDAPMRIQKPYSYYKLDGTTYKVRDVWERRELGDRPGVSAELPPHGSVLLELKP